MWRLRPFSKACCSSMRVERSQRLCVFPKYLSTQGLMGMGGTHCDMASTKQLSALGWQSLWAWWLPLHRNGPISPDRACNGPKGIRTLSVFIEYGLKKKIIQFWDQAYQIASKKALFHSHYVPGNIFLWISSKWNNNVNDVQRIIFTWQILNYVSYFSPSLPLSQNKAITYVASLLWKCWLKIHSSYYNKSRLSN